jgi:uncharacterized protein (TIGR03437 family)
MPYTVRPVTFAALLILLGTALVSLTNSLPTLLLPSVSAQSQVAVVNAASFASDTTLAPDAIAAAFGQFKTQNDQPFAATTLPLPTILGGVRVQINGVDAALFFTSNGQINFVVPGSTAAGTATITVTNADNTTRTGTMTVVAAAVGVFSARATGSGTAAAQTTFDGVTFENVANPDGSERPVDPGTKTRPNFLVLYATGLRHAPAANPDDGNGVAESVTATIQGVPSQVLYAGKQGGFEGLDQLNLVIPPQMAGLGIVRVRLTINGRTSNPVTILIGGTPPLITTDPISSGQTVAGTLTIDDQILADAGQGTTYFFDAYRFTAPANTSVALDLRSTQFDALVEIFQVAADGTLTFIAADDQTGGLCNCSNNQYANNNALLLTALKEAADYVVAVTSYGPNEVGNYTLKFTTNALTQIAYGSNVGDSIVASDIQNAAGYLFDVYWFSGTKGDRIRIDMTSSAPNFDPFLILNKGNGDFLDFDDNSGGGLNARITLVNLTTQNPPLPAELPETGIYVILATPLEVNRTGAYTLSLAKTGGAFQAEAAELIHLTLPGRQLPGAHRQRSSNFERTATRRVIGRQP